MMEIYVDISLMNNLPSNLHNRLRMIEQSMGIFWSENHYYQHFTNQGVSHSQLVLKILAVLLEAASQNQQFSSEELFVVFASTWLYEIGFQSQYLSPILPFEYDPNIILSPEQLMIIRKKRHLLTEYLIHSSLNKKNKGFTLNLGLLCPPDDYEYAIAEICRWISDDPLSEVPEFFAVNQQKIRIRLLVALLRLADQLYISEKRINYYHLPIFSLELKKHVTLLLSQYVQILPVENAEIPIFYCLPSSQKELLTYVQEIFEEELDPNKNTIIKYLWKQKIYLKPRSLPPKFDDGNLKPKIEDWVIKYFHGQIDDTNVVFDPNGFLFSKSTVNILFLAANPIGTNILRLDEEFREIDDNLLRTKFRDKFKISQSFASKYLDLSFVLQRFEPDIIHFSGHGSKNGGILLEDQFGFPREVDPIDLRDLFHGLSSITKCIIFSACWSQMQIQTLYEEFDFVISMSGNISNISAIRFSVGFYRALGSGSTIEKAFDLGCWEIGIVNNNEKHIPRLHVKNI